MFSDVSVTQSCLGGGGGRKGPDHDPPDLPLPPSTDYEPPGLGGGGARQ